MTAPLERARAIGPQLRSSSDEAEALRRLPAAVVALLADNGFFKLGLPEQYGGGELDPVAFIEVIDELARNDAAAAWCSMIASTTAPMAAYLPASDAEEIYGGDPRTVTGGAIAPSGVGRSVDGGFVVSGRWQWGSGTQHCQWICGGTIVDERDFRLVFFPAADVEILDTWFSSGLRGTGSTDFSVSELFAPAGRAVPIGQGRAPRIDRPLYRFPLFSLLSLAVASVCLGIARRAIEELVELAEVKTPAFASRRLAKSTMAQVDVARAEAALGSARAFLLDEVGATWADVLDGREISMERRARIRLAATNTGVRCAEAVDFAYNTGGGSSVYTSSPLQRCFRDIHTATQHLMVSPRGYEVFGRHLLGLPLDGAMI
ncbi:MAG TPA: acyl-CoA dehydrogenase family protein [Acidimicrobiales bacterium]|nr:acyl-CoA dehydrogenase family protein [Acidimicrobiales bacterium]